MQFFYTRNLLCLYDQQHQKLRPLDTGTMADQSNRTPETLSIVPCHPLTPVKHQCHSAGAYCCHRLNCSFVIFKQKYNNNYEDDVPRTPPHENEEEERNGHYDHQNEAIWSNTIVYINPCNTCYIYSSSELTLVLLLTLYPHT